MVFFFLVPSIPAVLGNTIPDDRRATCLPQAEPELVRLRHWRPLHAGRDGRRRVDTLDLLHTVQRCIQMQVSPRPCVFITGFSSISRV